MAAELHKTNHRYKINDIASIYSRAQWEKMQPLPKDEYGYFESFVPSLSDGIRLDVRMLMGEMPTQSGFVLVIRIRIRGRFFDPFLIKGLKYPVRNKSH